MLDDLWKFRIIELDSLKSLAPLTIFHGDRIHLTPIEAHRDRHRGQNLLPCLSALDLFHRDQVFFEHQLNGAT